MKATSKKVEPHHRVDDDQADNRQNDFQGCFEGGNELLNFLFQGGHFLQEHPDFQSSQSKHIAAELVLLGMEPNKSAGNREDVHHPQRLALVLEATQPKEEEHKEQSLTDLLRDLESLSRFLAFSRSVANDRNQEHQMQEELDLLCYVMLEDILHPVLEGFLFRGFPLFKSIFLVS